MYPHHRRIGRRTAVAAAAVTLALTALAACSSTSTKPVSTASSAPIALTAATHYAPQKAPAGLVAAAKKEDGSLIWYDSNPTDVADQVLAAFTKDYPFVTKAQQVKVLSTNVGTRVVQETQAGSRTADVATSDPATAVQLDSRGLLSAPGYVKAGIPKELVKEPYLVMTTAGVIVILYNKDLVSKADAPKTWDDLLDPKWKGKIAVWSVPYAFAELAAIWGDKRATDYVQKFAAQDPATYEDNFPLSQAVGAGEQPIGVTYYHTAQPAVKAGAPLAYNVPNPDPVTLLYSFIPKASKSPNTAKLFLYWLSTKEGASVYEKTISRGNPLLPGTFTQELIGKNEPTDFLPERAQDLSAYLTKYTNILRGK